MSENIFVWVLSGVLGLLNFLFWARIKRIEKDIENNRQRYEKIEKNYLTRFEKIHSKLNEIEKNIIKEIYEIKLLSFSGQKSAVSNKNSERRDN